MYDSIDTLDCFRVLSVDEVASNVKLKFARVVKFPVLGHCKDGRLLGFESEGPSYRPAVLEKDEGNMSAELERQRDLDGGRMLTKLVIPVTSTV